MGSVSVSTNLPDSIFHWGPFHISSSQSDFVLVLSAFLAIFASIYLSSALLRRRFPPSPALSLPVIGHLYLFRSFTHRGFSRLSKKYGPIFLLELGSVPTVVISSADLAKQFLLNHDETFAHRPHMAMAELVLYKNSASMMMSYSDRWRDIRKLYTQEILSVKSIKLYKQVRDEEISLVCENLQKRSGTAVQLRKVLFELTVNIMARIMVSQRADGRFAGIVRLLAETTELFIAPVIGDLIPYLRWLDLGGYMKRMDSLFQDWDMLLDCIVRERLKEMQEPRSEGKSMPSDLLNSLLEFNMKINASDHKIVKAELLELFGGGTETISTTVEWTMAELLRKPSTMQKLQAELDVVVGAGRHVEETDFCKLQYLQAVMKETWRLHPAAPLLLPHAAKESTEVAGYRLPKNTRLMVNVWAIGRDEKRWKEAEEFRPERFIRGGEEEGLDVKGRDYELLPFGTGRRGCPGIHLGIAVATLAVANLVHSFNWRVADSHSLCMDERMAITAGLAQPLVLIPTPRNHSSSSSPDPSVVPQAQPLT